MTAAHDHLRSVVDRVLNLKAQQDEISGDIKEVYAEAKALGLDKTAVGQLVAHLRKQKKDPKKFETNSALFETYLEAYEHGTPLATRAHAHEATPARPTAADRAARSKRRLSESMDDSKALSAEMLAAGLISEASHAENIRIADGVAMKLGAGVLNPEPDPDPTPPHDPTTGELIDDVPGNGPATGAGQRERGSEDADPSEEGADAIALDASSSQIKSNAKATEVEPGNAGGAVPVRHNNDRAGVASRLAGGRTPAGEGAEPLGDDAPSHLSHPAAGAAEQGLGTAPKSMPGPDLSQSVALALPVVTDAPVELSPPPDVAPGAPHSSDPGLSRARDGRPTKQETGDPKGSEAASAEMSLPGKSPDPIAPIPGPIDEWADLDIPARFDRREKAA